MKNRTLTISTLLFVLLCSINLNAQNIEINKTIEEKMYSIIDYRNVDVDAIEKSVAYVSNEIRKKKKKAALIYNKNLALAAYTHADQMLKYNFFNHINRHNKELRDLDDRAIYAGYENFETLSENILYAAIDINKEYTYFELATIIVEKFMSSPSHKENLLGTDITEIGCGIAFDNKLKDGFWYYYFTQDFGKRF